MWRIEGPGAPAGGSVVRARVPDALRRWAAALFPDYVVPGPDGGPDGGPGGARAPDVLVEGLPGGGFRVRGAGDARADDAASAVVLFEASLAKALLGRLEGVRPLHAAGALLGHGAVVLPAYGGAGKSTLAAALAAAGAPVHGDDVLLVDGTSGRVSSFRRLLRVPEDSRVRLGLPRPATPLAELWPESNLYRPSDLGSGWAPPARPSHVLFPVREEGSVPALSPVGAADAVGRLLRQALLVPRAGPEDFAAAASLLEGARAAELRYGDAAEAAAFLLSLEPGST